MRESEYWLNKIGIGLLLLGVAFLFKYSIDQGWITPAVRVGFGLAIGIILLAVGLRLHSSRRHFSQVLLGGCIATFYTCGFAAFQLFALVPHTAAMVFMVLVTVMAFSLSLRQNEAMLSVIGALGGLGTPFLLYTGAGNVPDLVAYTCLLLSGASAVYFFRGWRSLLWVCVVGGWLVFLTALDGISSDLGEAITDQWTLQLGVIFGWLAFGVLPAIREAAWAAHPTRWPRPSFGLSEEILETAETHLLARHVHLVSVSTPLITLMRNVAVPAWDEAREASAALFGFLEEHLSGTEDIRSNGGEAHSMNLLYGHAGQRLRTERRAGLRNVRLWASTGGLHVLGHLIGLSGGYLLYSSGAMTVGTVFMVIWYTDILFRPLEQLTRQMEDFQRASASIGRINHLRQTPATIEATSRADEGKALVREDIGAAATGSGALAVAFDEVTFGYNPEEPVLRDVSFDIAPGRVVGLLGRTGSGKTTISRLLFRLYDVQQGSITIGDVDVRQIGPVDLRRRVGIVTQNVQLFRGTVRENLTFFDASVPDDQIRSVVDTMGLAEWFEDPREGLDTPLTSGGRNLSAGEAQLLVFARVFLKNPGLVILDEASSRLDPATEAKIETAVDHLLTGRTGIIIAHRLSTVQRANEIVILDDGRIAEQGVRAELAENPTSLFSGLMKTGLSEVVEA